MLEVYHNLFVGSQSDYESTKIDENSFVLHAAKEPYHRAFVWYKWNCDKDNPEYLRAVRGKEIALNLVDAKESKYFNYDLIFGVVKDALNILIAGQKVYIHCNQGESRAPSIALLILLGLHGVSDEYELALKQFQDIYPQYNPNQGVKDFIRENWEKFVEASKNVEEEPYRETTPEEEGFVKISNDIKFNFKK